MKRNRFKVNRWVESTDGREVAAIPRRAVLAKSRRPQSVGGTNCPAKIQPASLVAERVPDSGRSG